MLKKSATFLVAKLAICSLEMLRIALVALGLINGRSATTSTTPSSSASDVRAKSVSVVRRLETRTFEIRTGRYPMYSALTA